MEGKGAKSSFRDVIRTVAARLSAHDFSQRGQLLQKVVGGNVALVEFQLSDKSSKERLIFTVNLGVVCGALMDRDSSRGISTMDAHLRQRLGFLLPGHADEWWEISAETDVIALANQLSAAIEERALPYLNEYLNSNSLIALWESGKSPGLTASQRARFLEKLKGSAST